MTKYDIAVAKKIIKKKGLKGYLLKTTGKEEARVRKQIAKTRKLKRKKGGKK
jgi:hypothetical protein